MIHGDFLINDLRPALRWLVALRSGWLVCAATAIASAPLILDFSLPVTLMLSIIALMVGFNFLAWRRGQGDHDIAPQEIFRQLCVDLIAMAVLLFLSGGASNPVISLLLMPIAMGALSLSIRYVAAITLLAIAIYSCLTVFFIPLSIADAQRATQLHLTGMWLTFVVSAIAIAGFVTHMTAEVREAREQALLGAQAADAAHSLSTPLATMAIVIGDVEHSPALTQDMRENMQVLQSQIARCKHILTQLSHRADSS